LLPGHFLEGLAHGFVNKVADHKIGEETEAGVDAVGEPQADGGPASAERSALLSDSIGCNKF